MAHSLSDIRDWWKNLAKDSLQDDGLFTLVAALSPFVVSRNPTPHNAVTLFWELYQPKSSLSAQDEQRLLVCLDWMHENYLIPYEPDSEESLDQLIICIHIAAARAFRIRQAECDQWSEEVLTCLTEVDQLRNRLFAPRATKGLKGLEISMYVGPALGLCLLELSRVRKSSGEYERALHYLAEAAINNFIANDFVQGGDAWDIYQRSRLSSDEDVESLRSMLGDRLTDLELSLKEAASFWEPIKAGEKEFVDSWGQVSQDCRFLADTWFVTGIDDTGEDDHLTWRELWLSAEAWASAQLSPSESRKQRDQDEKDASKNRLEKYFFGNNWDNLPERAQSRLISADGDWNSRQRIALEGVLNHILRAATATCYEFIWYPLEFGRGINIPEFVDKLEELGGRIHTDPGLSDYIWVCEQDFYKKFLSDRELHDDVQFLTEDLPAALHLLRSNRNTAEYEEYKTESPWSRESLRPFFNSFLGIGQPGILPQLARIGRKLQTSGK